MQPLLNDIIGLDLILAVAFLAIYLRRHSAAGDTPGKRERRVGGRVNLHERVAIAE